MPQRVDRPAGVIQPEAHLDSSLLQQSGKVGAKIGSLRGGIVSPQGGDHHRDVPLCQLVGYLVSIGSSFNNQLDAELIGNVEEIKDIALPVNPHHKGQLPFNDGNQGF